MKMKLMVMIALFNKDFVSLIIFGIPYRFFSANFENEKKIFPSPTVFEKITVLFFIKKRKIRLLNDFIIVNSLQFYTLEQYRRTK